MTSPLLASSTSGFRRDEVAAARFLRTYLRFVARRTTYIAVDAEGREIDLAAIAGAVAQLGERLIATYWIDRYERLLRGCVRDRDLIDQDRCYDLYFHKLMSDPFGELQAIYEKAGIPFDDQTRAAFQRAVDENQRGKHGQLGYDLREDFGIDPNEIRERFSFYFDRFPEVQVEVA